MKLSKVFSTLIIIISFSTVLAQNLVKEDYKFIKTKFRNAGIGLFNSSIGSHYDKHNDIFKIESGNIMVGESNVQFFYYLNKKDSVITRSPIYLKVNFRANNWIFLESISFALAFTKKGDDQLTQRASVNLPTYSRDVNANATVSESSSAKISNELLQMINQTIEKPRSISVRFNGDTKYTESLVFGRMIKKKSKNFFLSTTLFEEVD